MSGYYEGVNQELLALVDTNARSICEFGCASGAFAREVRKRNPEVYYAGIDVAEGPLARARDALSAGLLRNIDQVPVWAEDAEMAKVLPPESFDYVIFGDVLEHLYDPDRAIEQATRLLKTGGCLLASIPNVQHWSVFAQLVLGCWPRMDMGLFDRTHIRWFTLNDSVALLQKTGDLVVEKIVPRIFDVEQGTSVMEYLEPLAMYLGADTKKLVQQGLPLQYVLLARKTGA